MSWKCASSVAAFSDGFICWHGKLQYAFVFVYADRKRQLSRRMQNTIIISNWFLNNISDIIGNVENDLGAESHDAAATLWPWKLQYSRISALLLLANGVCFGFCAQTFRLAARKCSMKCIRLAGVCLAASPRLWVAFCIAILTTQRPNFSCW